MVIAILLWSGVVPVTVDMNTTFVMTEDTSLTTFNEFDHSKRLG